MSVYTMSVYTMSVHTMSVLPKFVQTLYQWLARRHDRTQLILPDFNSAVVLFIIEMMHQANHVLWSDSMGMTYPLPPTILLYSNSSL